MKTIVSVYGSHNATVALYHDNKYHIVEVERWLNKKNAGLITYLPSEYPQLVFDEIIDYLRAKTGFDVVDLYLTNYADISKLKPKFQYKQHINFDHHTAHAACAFYQSPFDESIVFTFDGGGDNGFFNVYKASRLNGIELLERFNQDLGFAYMIISDHLEDIKRDPLNIGNLVYAGKLMGLCSYGKVRKEWVPAFNEFYEKFNYVGNSYLGGAEVAIDALPELMKKLGINDFNNSTRVSGQIAWDMAATTQYVFEDQFFKFASKYLEDKNISVCLSGGCALNVILNSIILKINKRVFIPPNTNDCGIAVGGILNEVRPETPVDLTYSGIPILDSHMLMSYIENNRLSIVENISAKELAEFIHAGNIVGVIQGNSEHGSRALGNRSILCNPIGDMKDVLNEKVKHREWYRPFAPIVRLEDATTYFEFPEGVQSRHMTYVADVKSKWRKKLPAITHKDNSARLQTVTKNQNPFIYELLTEFSKISDHSVLLNTSFNVNGKPILSRLSDALDILTNSKMDAVYYDNKLIFRRGEEKIFKNKVINTNVKPLDESATLYIIDFSNKPIITKNHLSKLNKKIRQNVVYISEADRLSKAAYSVKIGGAKLYYHELITSKTDVSMKVKDFYDYVKLLWIKPIMQENVFRTKYHVFVDVTDLSLDNFHHDAMNAVSFVTSNNDKILIKEVDDKAVSKVFGGSLENIEWLSNQYEAILLQEMRHNNPQKESEYLNELYEKHKDRFVPYYAE